MALASDGLWPWDDIVSFLVLLEEVITRLGPFASAGDIYSNVRPCRVTPGVHHRGYIDELGGVGDKRMPQQVVSFSNVV